MRDIYPAFKFLRPFRITLLILMGYLGAVQPVLTQRNKGLNFCCFFRLFSFATVILVKDILGNFVKCF